MLGSAHLHTADSPHGAIASTSHTQACRIIPSLASKGTDEESRDNERERLRVTSSHPDIPNGGWKKKRGVGAPRVYSLAPAPGSAHAPPAPAGRGGRRRSH